MAKFPGKSTNECWGAIAPLFLIMTNFYLNQLTEVETDPPKILTLSPSTICMCLVSLIDAEDRENWVKDLQAVNDTQWAEAEDFYTLAINELMGDTQMELLMAVTLNGAKSYSGNAINNTMEFQRIEYDPDNLYSTSDWAFTVPEDGVYIVGGAIEIVDISTPNWARIRVQETTENPASMIHSSGTVVQDGNSPHITAKFEGPAGLLKDNKLKWFASHNDTVNRSTTGYFKLCRAWVYRIR